MFDRFGSAATRRAKSKMKKLLVLAAVSAMAFGAKAEYWTVDISDAKAVYFVSVADTSLSVDALRAGWDGSLGGYFTADHPLIGSTWDEYFAALEDEFSNPSKMDLKASKVSDGVFQKFANKETHTEIAYMLLALDSEEIAPGAAYTVYRATGYGDGGEFTITDTIVSQTRLPGGSSPTPAPEPTSGLLLLLGVAGLALKRKRA